MAASISASSAWIEVSSGNAVIISSQSVWPLRTPASWGRYEISVFSVTRMIPSSREMMPAMILSNVDLPAPLTPTRATLSRSPISNVTPSRAWWPPYAFLISCTRSIVVAPGGFRPDVQAWGQDGGPARPARRAPGARQHRLRAKGRTVKGVRAGIGGRTARARPVQPVGDGTGGRRSDLTVCPGKRDRVARPTMEYTRRHGCALQRHRSSTVANDSDALVAALRVTYDLTSPVMPFALEHAGLNNANIGIQTGAGTFVARVHESLCYDDAGSFAYEPALLTSFAVEGLSFAVPVPLPTRDGEPGFHGRRPGGWTTLTPKLPVTPLARQTYDPALFVAALGELQAALLRHPTEPRPGRPLFTELFDFGRPALDV